MLLMAKFLLPTDKAVMIFHPLNSVMYEMHVNVLPEDRQNTIKSGKAAWKYMFTKTDCEKMCLGCLVV